MLAVSTFFPNGTSVNWKAVGCDCVRKSVYILMVYDTGHLSILLPRNLCAKLRSRFSPVRYSLPFRNSWNGSENASTLLLYFILRHGMSCYRLPNTFLQFVVTASNAAPFTCLHNNISSWYKVKSCSLDSTLEDPLINWNKKVIITHCRGEILKKWLVQSWRKNIWILQN